MLWINLQEVSAQFVPPEKFSAVCADLQSPACTVATLRLFHNEPEHTAAMLAALAHNTSVVDFDISELDAQGAALLEAWLSSSQTLKGLTVHHMHCAPAVARAASGIASSHALTSLHLSGLDAVGISAFARALANWSPSRLQSFTLQASSFTGEAAAHLGEALASQAGALKSMTVTSSHLADQVAASLLAPLAHVAAAGLVSLNLSANRIAAEGAP